MARLRHRVMARVHRAGRRRRPQRCSPVKYRKFAGTVSPALCKLQWDLLVRAAAWISARTECARTGVLLNNLLLSVARAGRAGRPDCRLCPFSNFIASALLLRWLRARKCRQQKTRRGSPGGLLTVLQPAPLL